VYNLIDALPLPSIAGGVDLTVRPLSEKQIIRLLDFALANHVVRDAALVRRYLNEFEREDSVHAATLHIGDSTNRLSVYPYLATGFRSRTVNYSERGYSTFSVDSLSNKNEVRNETNYGIRLRALVFNAPFSSTAPSQRNTALLLNGSKPTIRILDKITQQSSPRGERRGILWGSTSLPPTSRFRTRFRCHGRQPAVRMGYSPGMGFSLFRSIQPVFNVRIDKKIGKLDYEFVMGKLVADTYAEQKYVYAKRLTYQPFDWASIGFSDQEITMNRGVEPAVFFAVCSILLHRTLSGRSRQLAPGI